MFKKINIGITNKDSTYTNVHRPMYIHRPMRIHV